MSTSNKQLIVSIAVVVLLGAVVVAAQKSSATTTENDMKCGVLSTRSTSNTTADDIVWFRQNCRCSEVVQFIASFGNERSMQAACAFVGGYRDRKLRALDERAKNMSFGDQLDAVKETMTEILENR